MVKSATHYLPSDSSCFPICDSLPISYVLCFNPPSPLGAACVLLGIETFTRARVPSQGLILKGNWPSLSQQPSATGTSQPEVMTSHLHAGVLSVLLLHPAAASLNSYSAVPGKMHSLWLQSSYLLFGNDPWEEGMIQMCLLGLRLLVFSMSTPPPLSANNYKMV